MWPESVWSLLLVEFGVVRFGGWSPDICNKLLLNFCLKQIENNGPLINMIYKVLKNSAQGLLSSIHVRLLALKCAHPIAFSSSSQCSGFYRCLLVPSSAFCKILFSLAFFSPPSFGVCMRNSGWPQCLVSFYCVLKMNVSNSDSSVSFWKCESMLWSSLCCHVHCLIVSKLLTVLIMSFKVSPNSETYFYVNCIASKKAFALS